MIKRREEFRKNVIDDKKNVAVGISLPFGEKPLFRKNYTTKEQVKTNLINYMMTNKGERPFNPEYGANLRQFVFEQTTSTEELHDIILDKLRLYFPQITVDTLYFDIEEDKNKISIKLNYFINKSTDSLLIQLK